MGSQPTGDYQVTFTRYANGRRVNSIQFFRAYSISDAMTRAEIARRAMAEVDKAHSYDIAAVEVRDLRVDHTYDQDWTYPAAPWDQKEEDAE